MEAYQERVIEEKKQLDERLTKLIAFLDNAGRRVPPDELHRLGEQREVMLKYSSILADRITNFK